MDQTVKSGLRSVRIEDRYDLNERSVFLSGTQALVRLLIEQRAADARAGLNTAGFVSGYRGSPLGGLDFALWHANRELTSAGIVFSPGLNEELAATAVLGTQQIENYADPRHEGVFGLWYGKNPGLDRMADALKHANMEGVAARGGVLAVSGDDPAAASSSIANQCEQAFMAAMVPVLYPGTIADIFALGLAGFAMSRYCGLWVGFKLVADTVESSASVELTGGGPFRPPADFTLPPGGLGHRRNDTRWAQDERMQRFKLPAARAFARANGLDRTVVEPNTKRIGFIAAGKAFRDLAEAFEILGLEHAEMARFGIGLRKIALLWPFEDVANAEFARGFGELVVIEEKRAVIEPQLMALAYHWPADLRPRILGKRDERGAPLILEWGETDPLMLARLVAARLEANGILPPDRLAPMQARLGRIAGDAAPLVRSGPARTPHFCAGCPHGRSTRLPEGSRAMAGIGCHSMIMWAPGSDGASVTQMGGEGANWIGAAPFVETKHVFQNLGDGTFFHSGILAIRAAVAAGTTITYKILLNGAVAMTGGQPVEGAPDAARIAWQLHAEGVERIALLTGRGGGFAGAARDLPPGVRLGGRDELDSVMRAFREHPGVSAIIYDQICATEKRRLRKRVAAFADEPVVVINERLCEGCGDCSVKSRCVAVVRADTPFGVKRRIDQSTCNTDMSCMDGFCPSLVSLEKAVAQPACRTPLPGAAVAALPDPARAAIPDDRPHSIVVAGVGGSGLITIGALLGMAAHLEGQPVTVLDNTGLARKGGEVTTHVRLGPQRGEEVAARIPNGMADLLIAGDLATAADPGILVKLGPSGSAVVRDETTPMIDQAIDPEAPLPDAEYRERLAARLDADALLLLEAGDIARAALDDSIYANMILLGAGMQAGLIPVGRAAIEEAVRLNGIGVADNLAALAWGRLAVAEPALVSDLLRAHRAPRAAPEFASNDLDAQIEFFAAELTRYQDRALAERYRRLVIAIRDAERALGRAQTPLALLTAKNAYKALAIKDEYEVARLASDPDFFAELRRRYGAQARPVFHLAPPFLPTRMTRDGRGGKRRFGPWMRPAMRALAALRFLRGGPLDLFGRQAERRAERQFAELYCSGLAAIAGGLSAENYEAANEFARLPDAVRGYGHVKAPHLAAAIDAARRTRALFS
ncbi:MAG: indolepyruvate ferredoxin oxidoreductase family protein [Xanthobacteraceae bacterium]